MEVLFYLLAVLFTLLGFVIEQIKLKVLLGTSALICFIVVIQYNQFVGYDVTVKNIKEGKNECTYSIEKNYNGGSVLKDIRKITIKQPECVAVEFVKHPEFKRIVREFAGTTYVEND